jgi:hypothetical protein
VRAEQFFSRTGSGLVIPGSLSVDSTTAQKAGATVKASVEEKGGQRF